MGFQEGGIFLPSFHLGTSRVTPKTTYPQTNPKPTAVPPNISVNNRMMGTVQTTVLFENMLASSGNEVSVNYLLLRRHLASNA